MFTDVHVENKFPVSHKIATDPTFTNVNIFVRQHIPKSSHRVGWITLLESVYQIRASTGAEFIHTEVLHYFPPSNQTDSRLLRVLLLGH